MTKPSLHEFHFIVDSDMKQDLQDIPIDLSERLDVRVGKSASLSFLDYRRHPLPLMIALHLVVGHLLQVGDRRLRIDDVVQDPVGP